jgi:glycosyltransferase involved in cell wall biosynthesis
MSQRNIFFSIIIPTYNRASLILETIESVFYQTYTNYEILVIDNFSTDNTKEVLRSLIEQKRIKYICNEKNYERAYSRNVGLKNASGDFVTLLDSDDFLYENCLLDAYNYIKKNPDAKLFHNKYEVVNSKRELVYRSRFPSIKNQYKALCSGNFMSVIGGFMHKDLYREMRFNEDIRMTGAEDYEFWFKAFALHKLGRIDKVNCGVREHENRSVNQGVYNQLHYQCNTMVALIKNDKLLNDKFGKYIGRLKASYILLEISAFKKEYPFLKKVKLICKAISKDYTVIFTHRLLTVTVNLFK